jgi:hypothetical protein
MVLVLSLDEDHFSIGFPSEFSDLEEGLTIGRKTDWCAKPRMQNGEVSSSASTAALDCLGGI